MQGFAPMTKHDTHVSPARSNTAQPRPGVFWIQRSLVRVLASDRLHIGGAAYFLWAYPPNGG
jgi:hypothetical protein